MKGATLYAAAIKRLLDITVSFLALVLLSPFLAILAILVRLKLGCPVVFSQPRPGMDEKIFRLYKFRSMTNAVGKDGRLLPDAQRLTAFGKFLRAASLDELLELVNILKGDMSIVGPRPLSIYYLPHYPPDFRRRHQVRPGLTGLAQVNGRNNLPWNARFALDIEYVDNVSLLLDAKIILDTLFKVLKHADISVRGTTQIKDYGPYRVLQEENAGGKIVENTKHWEIGSYFWLDGTENMSGGNGTDWLPQMDDSCFTFSGRNAIDLALRDILETRDVNVVFIPSYVCVSMVQAFVDRGMHVEFYQVEYVDGHFGYRLPKTDAHSLVLLMNYFGIAGETVHEAIANIHRTGAVVIEDITHSLLCELPCSLYADYAVASLRKWFAIPTGGWLGKRSGQLAEKPMLDGNHAVAGKISAMREKYSYLSGNIDSKEHFLLAHAQFDNDLIHVDRLLKLDDTSMSLVQGQDISSAKQQRKTNARILLDGLHNLNGSVLSLPNMDLETTTPLFVPVFLETEKRDALRTRLVGQGIYCPVHWPEVMGAPKGIRENELSLICDQRYSTDDMLAIVKAIHEWCEKP